MSERKCKLWMAIENGQKKVYSLTPLSAGEVGPDFVCGFRVVNRSEEPNPLYLVRVTPRAEVVCNCPAFGWDRRKAAAPTAPPDQPLPTCKHCESLRACGVLPVYFVHLVAMRSKLLDSATERIEQLIKNRDIEREAAIRNADSLRSTIAQMERELRDVSSRASQLQTSLAAVTVAPVRRRKVKAA